MASVFDKDTTETQRNECKGSRRGGNGKEEPGQKKAAVQLFRSVRLHNAEFGVNRSLKPNKRPSNAPLDVSLREQWTLEHHRNDGITEMTGHCAEESHARKRTAGVKSIPLT
ncbi:uncharacterized protein LOC143362775 [Halictus rubicundus]|uniref:uncharacterized protein LOC143362775 n=1 Tax=Halictus rubicundus TaxID=77578 RepID=UPI0040350035